MQKENPIVTDAQKAPILPKKASLLNHNAPHAQQELMDLTWAPQKNHNVNPVHQEDINLNQDKPIVCVVLKELTLQNGGWLLHRNVHLVHKELTIQKLVHLAVQLALKAPTRTKWDKPPA